MNRGQRNFIDFCVRNYPETDDIRIICLYYKIPLCFWSIYMYDLENKRGMDYGLNAHLLYKEVLQDYYHSLCNLLELDGDNLSFIEIDMKMFIYKLDFEPDFTSRILEYVNSEY